jgi:hypothetical protein
VLFGAIHPYFSPESYAFYEGRIEYYHWLSRDYFAHSEQCYFLVQYGLGWDSLLNNYNSSRALFNFDVRSWLSVGADASVILSPFYDATAAAACALIRFPCFHR